MIWCFQSSICFDGSAASFKLFLLYHFISEPLFTDNNFKKSCCSRMGSFLFSRCLFCRNEYFSLPFLPFLSPILAFLNPEICFTYFLFCFILSCEQIFCDWDAVLMNLLSFCGWDLFFLVAAYWGSVTVSHFAVIPDEEWVSLILGKWGRKECGYVSCVWIFWAFSLLFSQVWTVITLAKECTGITSS